MLGAALLAPLAGAADTGPERLDGFMADVRPLRAQFAQTLYDEKREPLEESSGTVWLQRPGRFRWEYRAPFAQTIVADGERLWVHDADLDQVTVRDQHEAVGDTPAVLLGSEANLHDRFYVTDLGRRDGLLWARLVPQSSEGGFEEIRLGFDAANLRAMDLVDGFGQLTRLTFSSVERLDRLPPETFVFTPPPGADVIENR